MQVIVETSATAINAASTATAQAVAVAAEQMCKGGSTQAAAQAAAQATASATATGEQAVMHELHQEQFHLMLY
jgi:hypothetical protein